MALESNSIFWVDVYKISPNPFQPRREFDESTLRDLAESIRMYGVLQPLTVTRKEVQKDDGGWSSEYELIAGERRLRASRLAGLMQVPVIIRTNEDSDRMKLELAIIENLQREDLHPVDRAQAFKQLAEQFKLTHSQVAVKVGRSREYVSNTIRLLLLPPVILNSMNKGEITEGHGRTLLILSDRPQEQHTLYREIILKKLSVREVERLSRKIASDKVRKKEWSNTDPELIEIEKQFTESLGTRVQISRTEFGGKVTIDYFSAGDLRKILEVIAEGKQHIPLDYSLDDENISSAPVTVHAHVGKGEMTPPVETVPVSTGGGAMPTDTLSASPTFDAPAVVMGETVSTVVIDEVAEVDKPLDDRSKDEKKEDPDLYDIKNFSL